jgi:uncharacterized protein (UPF0264 family)
MLVSVRNVSEALAAADAGADLIDLKDPSSGALGALGARRIAPIVAALRSAHPTTPISATTGDLPSGEHSIIMARVGEVHRCGVDYVKVGVQREPGSIALLGALAASGAPIVPVLMADRGIDPALLDAALRLQSFAGLMLDLADKRGGSLLQRLPARELRSFVIAVQKRHRLAGLAGALRTEDVDGVLALAPDFAGFRSAVCAGDRAGALDADRVRRLHERFVAPAHAAS